MLNKKAIDSVVIILKVVERCNINCSYCYFFNGLDTSFKQHAAKISLSTVEKLAFYWKSACEKHNITSLRIDFHGGEPLLLKPSYFSAICDILNHHLRDVTKLEFTVQTNAILFNKDWIALFNQYKVNVGISLDGPIEYHDKYRIDHKGNGTYVKTASAINLLRKESLLGNINFGIGILCVINPEFSARKIYRHFVDDLKLNSFDFLLPDNTWDSIKNNTNFHAMAYGNFLIELFDEWIKDNNQKIYIRILDSVIGNLLNRRLHFHDFGGWRENFLLITIDSNGGIAPDDTYRSANPDFMQLNLTLDNSSFDDLLNHSIMHLLVNSANKLPDNCHECCWSKFCKGGSLLHRYQKENEFTNHSIYCDGLKLIYKHINNFLQLREGKFFDNIY